MDVYVCVCMVDWCVCVDSYVQEIHVHASHARTGAAAGSKPRLHPISATPIVMSGDESAAPRRVRSAATPVVEARSSMVHVHHGDACSPVAKAPIPPPASVAGKGMEEVVAIGMVAAGSGVTIWRRWLRGCCGRGERGRRGAVAAAGRSGGGARHAEAPMMVVSRRRSRGSRPPVGWALGARMLVVAAIGECVRVLVVV